MTAWRISALFLFLCVFRQFGVERGKQLVGRRAYEDIWLRFLFEVVASVAEERDSGLERGCVARAREEFARVPGIDRCHQFVRDHELGLERTIRHAARKAREQVREL